jgi:hypothetical protein
LCHDLEIYIWKRIRYLGQNEVVRGLDKNFPQMKVIMYPTFENREGWGSLRSKFCKCGPARQQVAIVKLRTSR